MWNMFACLKKKSSSLFCLDSFSMLVLAERLGSSQPLNTQIDFPTVSNREGEETSKNTDCFGSFLNIYMCTSHWKGPPRAVYVDKRENLTWQRLHRRRNACFSICCSLFTWERNVDICFSAHFSVFGCAVWNHWRVMKTSYFWPHAMRGKHYKALCISLNRVFSNANRTKKSKWLKE